MAGIHIGLISAQAHFQRQIVGADEHAVDAVDGGNGGRVLDSQWVLDLWNHQDVVVGPVAAIGGV